MAQGGVTFGQRAVVVCWRPSGFVLGQDQKKGWSGLDQKNEIKR